MEDEFIQYQLPTELHEILILKFANIRLNKKKKKLNSTILSDISTSNDPITHQKAHKPSIVEVDDIYGGILNEKLEKYVPTNAIDESKVINNSNSIFNSNKIKKSVKINETKNITENETKKARFAEMIEEIDSDDELILKSKIDTKTDIKPINSIEIETKNIPKNIDNNENFISDLNLKYNKDIIHRSIFDSNDSITNNSQLQKQSKLQLQNGLSMKSQTSYDFSQFESIESDDDNDHDDNELATSSNKKKTRKRSATSTVDGNNEKSRKKHEK